MKQQVIQSLMKTKLIVEVIKTMAEQPKYKGDGVAVWENKDKNGNPYLSISLLNGSIKTNAFLNVPKETTEPAENEQQIS